MKATQKVSMAAYSPVTVKVRFQVMNGGVVKETLEHEFHPGTKLLSETFFRETAALLSRSVSTSLAEDIMQKTMLAEEPIHCNVLPNQNIDITQSTRVRDIATRWEVTIQLTFGAGKECFWCANGRAYHHAETALRHDAPPAAPSTSPPASSAAPTPGASSSASSSGPLPLLPSTSSRKRNRKKKGKKRPPPASSQSPPPDLAFSVASAGTAAPLSPSTTSSPVASEALPPSSSSLASSSPTPEHEQEEEKGEQKANSSSSMSSSISHSGVGFESGSEHSGGAARREEIQFTVGNSDDDGYITVHLSQSQKQKIKEQDQQFVDVLGASKERLDKLPHGTRLIFQALVDIKCSLTDIKSELAGFKNTLEDQLKNLAKQVTTVIELTAVDHITERLEQLGAKYDLEWRWVKKRLSKEQATSLYDKLGPEYTLLRERIGKRVCEHRPIPCSEADCEAERIKRLMTIEYNAIGDSGKGTIIAEFTTSTFQRCHLLEPAEALPEPPKPFEKYQVALLAKLAQLERQVAALAVVEQKIPLFAYLVVFRSEVSEQQMLNTLAAWKTALPLLYDLSQQQRFHMSAWCLDPGKPEHKSDAAQQRAE
ncbi:LysM domain-containing protein [Balamuthia mandrillaris]